MELKTTLRRRIKWLLWFFIISLVLSGITAFPLVWELGIIHSLLQKTQLDNSLVYWIKKVYHGVRESYGQYPFIAYGTDWLAFAHLVIAVAFIGPLRNPIRNIWVIQFGMIACGLVIPLALLAGAIREIPILWRLIDCSFGIIGIIPLWICYRDIRRLESIQTF